MIAPAIEAEAAIGESATSSPVAVEPLVTVAPGRLP
jgi:hypothetical protein